MCDYDDQRHRRREVTICLHISVSRFIKNYTEPAENPILLLVILFVNILNGEKQGADEKEKINK